MSDDTFTSGEKKTVVTFGCFGCLTLIVGMALAVGLFLGTIGAIVKWMVS